MEERSKKLPADCIEEAIKSNLRIRLHRFQTVDGSESHLVEVAAWNAWAGQGKIISALGGLDLDSAKEIFRLLAKGMRGYDWHEGEIIVDDS